jgi:hypothetical protein
MFLIWRSRRRNRRRWGYNGIGQTDVPAGLTGAVAVSGGDHYSLALRDDGTIVGWGGTDHAMPSLTSARSDVVAISTRALHNLAVNSDGTVVAWGPNLGGESTPPAGLSGVIAVAAGKDHSLAQSVARSLPGVKIPLARPRYRQTCRSHRHRGGRDLAALG